MYEVEVKLRISGGDAVRRALRELGASPLKEGTERDTYFRSNMADFSKTDEALRLRREDYGVTRWILAYKGPRLGGLSKSRLEIEAEVRDPGELMEILQKLGFTRLMDIRKERSIFQLRPFIISLDKVEGLGDFVEIERKAEDAGTTLDSEIDEVLRKLNLNRSQLVPLTYLELLLQRECDNERSEQCRR